ncbi:MAG: DUF4058 family protein [Gemmataceae bacterium]
MNAHDWTRVEDGMFHHFNTAWSIYLSDALNDGGLPEGFYVAAEQHAGRKVTDVLTLHRSEPPAGPPATLPRHPGLLSVAEREPRVNQTKTLVPSVRGSRRSLSVRHVSGNRIVALIEIVPPGNKSSKQGVRDFVRKVREALRAGVHVTVIDLFPPGRNDRSGLDGAVEEALTGASEALTERALTFAAYKATRPPVAYVDHPEVGEAIPDCPLFLTADQYVHLPLRATYAVAVRRFPWRDLIEPPAPPGGGTDPTA